MFSVQTSIVFVLALLLLLVSGIAHADDTNDALTATEIVRRCDEMLRGEKTYSTLTMVVTRPRWSRTVTMEAWTKGTENAFIRILSPSKEKGVTFLKKGREAWQYVPAVDRVIKLPPSMMLQSWMGSDFSNDDVVRADSIIVDYTHSIVEEIGGATNRCWIVDAVPKTDAPVVWGKIRMQIRQKDFVAKRADYYDEDGDLVKYYVTSDIKHIEGRTVATTFVMTDATRPGNTTSMHYDNLTFEPDITADTFSTRHLRQ